ncbi:exodeoxyribonuclease VII large subunit [Actimicrobium sp. CCC2.4]|uniref:exodeoxyribonuclease VII large subunit n=1 Tax=Actimicrobium sp. CCC2.4 TaxID=3048606 RepID=UPI002AC9E45E|nr:exodeoxyribonuclease VII large subunit [Actimicrobium sp. CCC2.4]MEB0134957.1 exodeoxyribonuclease VII large subunit [Actimicrobium sp. CCC2.4]WPX31993.1 exodeoxyribonuclease VII large subunit [Actimicrobium sp. CCC2.4]
MSTDHLFEPTDTASPVLTVSALNQAVSRMLERNFPLMWVAGEVSNFTRAASGHWYFSLKDASAQVRAVMFRGRAQYAGFIPKEGDKVEVRTLVTLYAARGDFQLSVETIRRAGVGNLFEAFLQLKQKLESEGLFDPARKRALPAFPRTIGIVTSLQAAALRDVLATLKRRTPHIRVILYPTPVQGDGAAQKIAQAIATASHRAECDLLLLCRGGGSIEDLWSFNDETVARTIAACAVPVIAGIGHETDFTIADFAADLRAPTPTAAAELAAPPRAEWIAHIGQAARNLSRMARRHVTDRSQGLDWLSRRLVSPAATIRHEQIRLAGWQVRLGNATRTPLNNARHALRHLRSQLLSQLPDTRPARWQLTEQRRRMASGIRSRTSRLRLQLSGLEAQLELLNPQRTLERGYAIIVDAEGRIARTPAQLRAREIVTVRLAEGSARVGIASVQPTLPE